MFAVKEEPADSVEEPPISSSTAASLHSDPVYKENVKAEPSDDQRLSSEIISKTSSSAFLDCFDDSDEEVLPVPKEVSSKIPENSAKSTDKPRELPSTSIASVANDVSADQFLSCFIDSDEEPEDITQETPLDAPSQLQPATSVPSRLPVVAKATINIPSVKTEQERSIPSTVLFGMISDKVEELRQSNDPKLSQGHSRTLDLVAGEVLTILKHAHTSQEDPKDLVKNAALELMRSENRNEDSFNLTTVQDHIIKLIQKVRMMSAGPAGTSASSVPSRRFTSPTPPEKPKVAIPVANMPKVVSRFERVKEFRLKTNKEQALKEVKIETVAKKASKPPPVRSNIVMLDDNDDLKSTPTDWSSVISLLSEKTKEKQLQDKQPSSLSNMKSESSDNEFAHRASQDAGYGFSSTYNESSEFEDGRYDMTQGFSRTAPRYPSPDQSRRFEDPQVRNSYGGQRGGYRGGRGGFSNNRGGFGGFQNRRNSYEQQDHRFDRVSGDQRWDPPIRQPSRSFGDNYDRRGQQDEPRYDKRRQDFDHQQRTARPFERQQDARYDDGPDFDRPPLPSMLRPPSRGNFGSFPKKSGSSTTQNPSFERQSTSRPFTGNYDSRELSDRAAYRREFDFTQSPNRKFVFDPHLYPSNPPPMSKRPQEILINDANMKQIDPSSLNISPSTFTSSTATAPMEEASSYFDECNEEDERTDAFEIPKKAPKKKSAPRKPRDNTATIPEYRPRQPVSDHVQATEETSTTATGRPKRNARTAAQTSPNLVNDDLFTQDDTDMVPESSTTRRAHVVPSPEDTEVIREAVAATSLNDRYPKFKTNFKIRKRTADEAKLPAPTESKSTFHKAIILVGIKPILKKRRSTDNPTRRITFNDEIQAQYIPHENDSSRKVRYEQDLPFHPGQKPRYTKECAPTTDPKAMLLLPNSDTPIVVDFRREDPMSLKPAAQLNPKKKLLEKVTAALNGLAGPNYATRVPNEQFNRNWFITDSMFDNFMMDTIRSSVETRMTYPESPEWLVEILSNTYDPDSDHGIEFSNIYVCFGLDVLVRRSGREEDIFASIIQAIQNLSDWVFSYFMDKERTGELAETKIKYKIPMPRLILTTIPEIGNMEACFKRFNEKLREYIDEYQGQWDATKTTISLLDWAMLVKEYEEKKGQKSMLEDRFNLLIEEAHYEFGLIRVHDRIKNES